MNMSGVAGFSRSVPRNGGLLLAFVGLSLLGAATFAAYRLPAPLPSDAPFNKLSAARVESTLSGLSGADRPHPLGSPEDAMMRRSITDRLQALGYSTSLQTRLTCRYGTCGAPTNVIATRDPRTDAGGAVLLAAHYDSVAAGPGASDDGVGVATLIEIARIMAARPPARHPLVLLLSDGEEAGLLGAQAFVQTHPLARRIPVRRQSGGARHVGLESHVRDRHPQAMYLGPERAIARPADHQFTLLHGLQAAA